MGDSPRSRANGAWKDIETLIRCYQQPTNDVMSEPTKVHEISGARNG
jgi:hypothetical protein